MSLVALALHEPRSERALGLVLIVCPTPEADVRDGGLPAARYFQDMIEFEGLARRAAAARLAHERALAAITLPDRTPDVGRDVTGVDGCAPLPGLWLGGGGELSLFELADEGVEGAVQHEGGIPGGKLVAEQGLDVLQLLVGPAADGDLEEDAPR